MTPAAVKFCYWLASCPAWSRGWGFGTSVAKAIFPYCKEARRLPNFSLSQPSRYGSELQDRESLVQTGSTKHLDFLSRRIFGPSEAGAWRCGVNTQDSSNLQTLFSHSVDGNDSNRNR
jgi:hypothetical protein